MAVFVERQSADFKHVSHSFPAECGHFSKKKKKKKSINCQFLLALFHIILTAWLMVRQLQAKVKVSDGIRLLLLTPSHILTPGLTLPELKERYFSFRGNDGEIVVISFNNKLENITRQSWSPFSPPHVLCGGGKTSQIHNVFFRRCVVGSLKLEADNHDCIRMLLSWNLSCFTLTRPLL